MVAMRTVSLAGDTSLNLANGEFYYQIVSASTPPPPTGASSSESLVFATIASDPFLRVVNTGAVFRKDRGQNLSKLEDEKGGVDRGLRGPETFIRKRHHGHEGGVTALVHADVGLFLTAGRDGAVRGWECEEKGWEVGSNIGLKFDLKSAAGGAPILSLAQSPGRPEFALGTELTSHVAEVQIRDVRNLKEPVVRYSECHSDDVTVLRYSTHNPTTLLSGSTDGLVNVYNTTVTDEDDALLQVINHGSSIHRAGFLSADDSTVFALSHDETLSFYARTDASGEAEEEDGDMEMEDAAAAAAVVALGDVRPLLDCEYVVDVIRTPSGDCVVAAGSCDNQRLELIPVEPRTWTPRRERGVRLAGAHGGEIVRSVCTHWKKEELGEPLLHEVITGGEDGKICLWIVDSASVEKEDDIEGADRAAEGTEDTEVDAVGAAEGKKHRKDKRKRDEDDQEEVAHIPHKK